MNGEVQITDLIISKLLRQNIEKYRILFPHVSAAIRLNVSGVIANRGEIIQYVHTDSKHATILSIFELWTKLYRSPIIGNNMTNRTKRN